MRLDQLTTRTSAQATTPVRHRSEAGCKGSVAQTCKKKACMSSAQYLYGQLKQNAHARVSSVCCFVFLGEGSKADNGGQTRSRGGMYCRRANTQTDGVHA